MKILFIVPPYPNRVSEYLILPSLEVCIQSNILKQAAHEVSLLDMKIDNMTLKQARNHIEERKPDYVCIDDEPNTHCMSILIAKIIKGVDSNIKVVMRGEIPTFVPESVLERNPAIDYVVRSSDDYALLRLISANNDNELLIEIPNIAYRNSLGKIVVTNAEYKQYDINTLPMPDRKIYDIKKYLRRDTETIVKSSRGCPGNCIFCIKTQFEKFQLFSIERFCDEIEELLSFGFTSFFFSDDTFAFSDQRVDEFYREVKKRKLSFKWTSNIRISDINDYKISRMKEIGAYRVFVGIETVNDDTQKTLNKNLSLSMIREKIAILKKYDIEFHASFILGNPGDNENDLVSTIEFVKEIQPTLVTFNLIKVYPGLDLYNNPQKYGIIMDDPYWYEKDDWSQKVVMGTTNLPPHKLEQWSRRCLFEFITS